MRYVFGLLIAFTASVLSAQTLTPSPLPVNFVFLGVGLNQSTPEQRIVGSFALGHLLFANRKLYSFTRNDILNVSSKPFQFQTVLTTGFCQITNEVKTKFFFGDCIDLGMAVSGADAGGAIGADGLAGVKLGKSGRWAVVVMGGVVKTALSGSLTPVRAGVVYGW